LQRESPLFGKSFFPEFGEAGMELENYVIEAASALAAPAEVWLCRQNFNYDWSGGEWRFEGSCGKGPKALADMREWMERICGWLQFKYPQGPGS
jgi:hypothetical protein